MTLYVVINRILSSRVYKDIHKYSLQVSCVELYIVGYEMHS